MPDQAIGQVAQVGGDKTVPVIRRLRHAVMMKKVAYNGPIGAAAERDAVRVGGHAEGRGHCLGPGRLAPAAAGEQRSVDVKKANKHPLIIAMRHTSEALTRKAGCKPALTNNRPNLTASRILTACPACA